jgi:hypothetical protein
MVNFGPPRSIRCAPGYKGPGLIDTHLRKSGLFSTRLQNLLQLRMYPCHIEIWSELRMQTGHMNR